MELAVGATSPTKLPSPLMHPYGLAVDSNGDVYVADSSAGSVVKPAAQSGGRPAALTSIARPTGC